MGEKRTALREAASILISSLWAAWVAGAAMAALNGIAEELQGGSVWGWGGLYRLQIWHVLAWTLFGLVWGALNILRRIRHRTEEAFGAWLGFPMYLAIWLFVIGYANLYWLPVMRSAESLAASALLVLAAAFLYRIGDKALGIRIKRPHLAWLTVALALVGVASFIGETGLRHSRPSMHPSSVITLTSRPPNVLLVVLDAVRPDHLGCYGYARPTSPRLDRFAAESIIFEDAFAPSAYTQESAPALFTSAYPSTHGMFNFTDRLPTDFPLLPETFHRHGYRTGIFSTIRNVSAVFGYDRGMDDIFGVEVDPMEGSLLSQYLLRLSERRLPLISGICRGLLRLSRKLFACRDRVGTEDPRIITEQVAEWIGEDTDRPFFAYIHYRGGHHDYIPPAPYDRLFDPSYPGKPVISYPQGQPSFPPFVYSRPLSGPARTNMIAQYDGEIRLHDEAMGRLFEALERMEIAERTIIVITAVHGEEFFEHGGWGHGQSLHDELIHVPLIVRIPESPLLGKRVKTLVSLIDIYPTLCSLCGVSFGDGDRTAAGQDLSPLLWGMEIKALRDHVYAELHQGGHSARMLRTQTHKAIWARHGRKIARLLYDIRKDPRETNALAPEDDPHGGALFRKMEDLARAARLSR